MNNLTGDMMHMLIYLGFHKLIEFINHFIPVIQFNCPKVNDFKRNLFYFLFITGITLIPF